MHRGTAPQPPPGNALPSQAVNLKSRFADCSYGKLTFNPATGPNIVDGVAEIDIGTAVVGATYSSIENLVTQLAPNVVGSLSQYDHVAYCIPRGTVTSTGSANWVAYGYFNWYRTVYNGEWCGYVSGQMHEVGHNLNLHHSGQGTNEYGDQSGYMGYSYSQHEGPSMCFNAAKNNELGWYGDRQLTLDGSAAAVVQLAGLSEYALTTVDYTVVLKILTPSQTNRDLYLAYNRAAGINSGTAEFANRVTVVSAGEPGTRSISTLDYSIAAGGTLSLANFEGSGNALIIEFCEVRSAPIVHAKLSVYLDDGIQGSTCLSESPTAAPVAAPVPMPTPPPVFAPSPAPTTPAPTVKPTPKPTASPTVSPTAFVCRDVGQACQNKNDCCSGVCRGKRNQKTCRA